MGGAGEGLDKTTPPHSSNDGLTPDRPERLVPSPSAGVRAIVLCVRPGWGAAEGEARGGVHLGGGRLAAAAVAVAANAAAERVLRRRGGQAAGRKRAQTETHEPNVAAATTAARLWRSDACRLTG